jgi:hypothetical protein
MKWYWAGKLSNLDIFGGVILFGVFQGGISIGGFPETQ